MSLITNQTFANRYAGYVKFVVLSRFLTQSILLLFLFFVKVAVIWFAILTKKFQVRLTLNRYTTNQVTQLIQK